jgi:hypothetical protein
MTPFHHYGDTFVGGELAERGTIHGSATIDIQVDPVTHEVRHVWYRCLSLPFTVSEESTETHQPPIEIIAVDYVEAGQ